ncbi:MAG: bifunctional (p)ppGpp synthetase/guanosine-3',5'-bis(diphosphate) 3'-pyrophosphohydrolase [Rhizobiaceae bacterium]|nr:bifunctional (p)ppGpp synthetase/guanosine-3',5'-bis(diphosphate) 3'-pyrophosphohydrolase [Rhizobiaceae bacterium]
MMRQYELVERIQRYKPDVNETLLNKAYVYAMQKHGHQKRASGDPYFSHPLEVAAILTDMHLDESTVAVALLHDTIEDTTATRQEIDQLFGPDIGRLVEGLTKLKKLDLVSKKAEQAENLRKLLLAISEDVRVLLVKLADRLHNMRTLDHMRPEKRARIAEETMEIYAPLAGRMGMQGMREELEELAFRHINPEAHRMVTQRLDEIFARTGNVVDKIEASLKSVFEQRHLVAKVKSRRKKPWSIFRKMETKAISFDTLSDLIGFRVVAETTEDCYRVLGAIHTTWSMVPGRFKDYISTPKQNDYRSIHTTIVGPERQRVELQIRTSEMNYVAEYGVAAHSLYKDGRTLGGADNAVSAETNAYAWLRRTIEQLAEGDSPEDFLENTKLELFQDQVFCFTPKGLVIALPRGATPIDFAYAVHTDVGDTCVGVKINGRTMPLMTELKNGDEVEIIRSDAQVPPAAWESMVVTGKARAAIRRATKNAVRKQYSGLGVRILERAFGRAGKTFGKDLLKPVLPRLARKDVEDVLAAVGRGELASNDVLRAVHPDYKEVRVTVPPPRPREEGWSKIRNAAGMIFQLPGLGARKDRAERPGTAAVPIRGVSGDLPVKFAPEGAVPGDRIVGILQPGVGITVYPIQSPALTEFDDQPERWIDVRWDIDGEVRERFPARITVTAINAPGSLAEIAQLIAANDANVHSLTMTKTAPDFTEMMFDLEVWDLKHLNRLIGQLKETNAVSEVKRVNG